MIEQQATVNGRYRVDQLVGEGGMAVVYRGYDLLLGREVAIKALRPQYAADPSFRTRFEREARAAAGFHHPNIIDIYDVGEDGETPYIVMEFVQGQNLKEIILNEAPFHPDDVAALLRQLAAALDYAHERGYVHRDVKPQNILVDADGHARVVDFGIAKGLGDSDLTDTGMGLGTVHYLSPEQASGLMATPASDVYSAGIVAFEMLTGRLPFEADTSVGVAMRQVNDTPPTPSDFLPLIPPAVDAVVLRALAKDPTQRFLSAGALAQAMAQWRRSSPNPPRSERATHAVTGARPEGASATTAPIFTAPRNEPAGARSAAPPTRRASTARPADRGSGAASVIVGFLIFAGLVGLIWLGFRLSRGTGEAPPATMPAVGDVADPTETGAPAAMPTDTAVPPPAIQSGGPPTAVPTSAPAAVPAPKLIGLTADEARAALAPRGLTLQEGAPVDDATVPAGRIARQSPAANAGAEPGSAVAIRLSAGPPAVDLDALRLAGQPADAAERALAQAGLAVQRVEVGSPSVAAGAVVALDPAHRARPGETVRLRVSAGDRVQIPADIQGQPLDRATRAVQQLGLRVGAALPVDRATISGSGLDPDAAGIADGDVVGVQGHQFGDWVGPGTSVDLVYYDRKLDGGS